MSATPSMSDAPRRHAFTVEEFNRLSDSGLFDPEQRLELVDGEIYEMTPARPSHAVTVDRLTWHVTRKLPEGLVVRVQGPAVLGDYSQPEPDYLVLQASFEDLGEHHPTPDQIVLLVEVALTSYPHDRGLKLDVYARAGVATYWIVDLERQWIEVFTEPSSAGYGALRVARGGEVLSVPGTDVTVAVEDIVG